MARQGTNRPHAPDEAQQRFRGDETAALVEAEVVKPVAGVVEEVEPHPSRLVRVVIDVMPDVTGSRPEAALRTSVSAMPST